MWTNYGTNIAKHDILIPFWFPSFQHLQCSSKNCNNIIILYNPSSVCQKLIKRCNPVVPLFNGSNILQLIQLWFLSFQHFHCGYKNWHNIIIPYNFSHIDAKASRYEILMPVRQRELAQCNGGKTWYFLWFSLRHRYLCYAANETTGKLQCDTMRCNVK
jgi:hypothetical protein